MIKDVKVCALRFLKRRPHSIVELKEKLYHKSFPGHEIEEVIQDLRASGFLDDRVFTNSWIHDRLARPFGFRRIESELKAKGVDQELIEEVIGARKDGYREKDVAWSLAQRRLSRMSGVDKEKKKQRIADFLLRRGFSQETVMQVIRRL